jgi:hypothetical protein
LLDGGVGEDPRITEGNQNGALVGLDEAGNQGKRAELGRSSATGTKELMGRVHSQIVRESTVWEAGGSWFQNGKWEFLSSEMGIAY